MKADTIEELAAIFYDYYRVWTEQILKAGEKYDAGSLTISAGWVKKLQRQAKALYSDLPDSEKHPHRETAKTIIKALEAEPTNILAVPDDKLSGAASTIEYHANLTDADILTPSQILDIVADALRGEE
jgi:hypothetical protein